jgi:uncharacterized membrane protein
MNKTNHRRRMATTWVLSLGCFLAALAYTEQASANLTICNQTSKPIVYAFATADGGCNNCGGESKHGWYSIAAGACRLVWNGSIQNKQFLWYARSTDGTMIWTSDTFNFQHNSPNAEHHKCFDWGQLNLDRCVNGTFFFDATLPYFRHRSTVYSQADMWQPLVP